MTMKNLPPIYLVGAVVAVILIVAGAAVALGTDNVSEARFGLLLGLAGTAVAGLLTLARANDAANVSDSTKADTAKLVNGHLEDVMTRLLAEHDKDVHGINHDGADQADPEGRDSTTTTTTQRTFHPRNRPGA